MESLRGGWDDEHPTLIPGKDYFSGIEIDDRFAPPPGMEDELWTNDDKIDGLMVSSYGMVYFSDTDSFLKHRLNAAGYPCVTLHRNGWHRIELVHRLVCRNFIDNPNPTIFNIVRHLNGDRADCHYTNLRWGTQRDNMHDAMDHGTFAGFGYGAKPGRRATPIRAYLKTGQVLNFSDVKEAADCLGYSSASIYMVLSGRVSSVKGDYFVWAKDDD